MDIYQSNTDPTQYLAVPSDTDIDVLIEQWHQLHGLFQYRHLTKPGEVNPPGIVKPDVDFVQFSLEGR